jgi:pimeloyl-ACP methyl ester carboxylesterase
MSKAEPQSEFVFEAVTAGDPEAPLLFFVHGWPDDASLWRKQFEALSGQFYCIAVNLPNFGAEPQRPGGLDFPALVAGLAASIRKHQKTNEPVRLVCHDWGAYLGYLLQRTHPDLIARMVALDVGGHAKPANIKEVVFILGYQWALVFCWLIGGILPPLGNALSRALARLIRVPKRQVARLKSRFNYPYFYFWRGMFLSRWKSSLLGYYQPSCPLLYLFGEGKPVMFHSKRWLKIVADSGGRCQGIEGAGHWFMETHPDIVNQAIANWCRPSHPES